MAMPSESSKHSRAGRLLEFARSNASFRASLIRLGQLADDAVYPDPDRTAKFYNAIIELASESGLLTEVAGDQKRFDELIEWFEDSASELSYFASPLPRFPSSPLYREQAGLIFLSWTVKTPRDRMAVLGIKKGLDWFNLEYFDYTEHQLDDDCDATEAITGQLQAQIASARISVEVISAEVGRPWVQFERQMIAKQSRLHRYFVCLEQEKLRCSLVPHELEQRVTRLDFSGGRLGAFQTAAFEQWMAAASDTAYFQSEDFYRKCYSLASTLRNRLSASQSPPLLRQIINATTFAHSRDEARFLSQVR